jgi:hypothetical protein
MFITGLNRPNTLEEEEDGVYDVSRMKFHKRSSNISLVIAIKPIVMLFYILEKTLP